MQIDSAERQGVWRLLDYFIHPKLHGDADILHRVRLLVAALIIFNILLTAVAAFVFFSFASPASAVAGIGIDVIIVGTNTIMLLTIKRSGSYALCAAIEIFMIFIAVVFGIFVSAGIATSPVAQLLVLGPLLGYVFGGVRWGTCMLLLTLLVIALFVWLQIDGYPFIQTIASGDIAATSVMITSLNLSAVAAMALVYERTTANLQRERDAEHQRYMRLARTDSLTGLENRRNFDALVERRIDAAAGSAQLFTLCFIDLDGFKSINDRHGHNVGDEVLRVVADRLRSASRSIDVVSRHGGDEFMVMLDAVRDRALLESMAQRLISSIEQPISTSVGLVEVSASIGFAQYPTDASELEALKRAADIAMYTAKRNRAGWVFYRSELGTLH
ncbi:MAG TPA: GGDEF domain-containing protein [Spongiibacteraceae bacterium]|nr:GGDEF domain-containing protein [Spongiibacteraceae bacterium]